MLWTAFRLAFIRVLTGTLAVIAVVLLAVWGSAGATASRASLGYAAAKPGLRVQPGTVVAGGRLTLIGSGFKHNEVVRFYVGPPRAGADYWGSTRTGGKGGFRKAFRINPRVGTGRWVVVACQRGCRIKASASFRTKAASGRGATDPARGSA